MDKIDVIFKVFQSRSHFDNIVSTISISSSNSRVQNTTLNSLKPGFPSAVARAVSVEEVELLAAGGRDLLVLGSLEAGVVLIFVDDVAFLMLKAIYRHLPSSSRVLHEEFLLDFV